MPDLDFRIEGAEPVPYAAAPTLALKLRVTQKRLAGEPPTAIHSVALRCQIRLEPGRRRYTPREQERLSDLFGEPHRWGQTVRSMLWTHTGIVTPPFAEELLVDLPVPCTFDFNVAAAKYFDALDDGLAPVCVLFNGTIFYAGDDGGLQVEQISWEKEADYALPVSAWKRMIEVYYPNTAWLCLRKDVYDRLARYKSQRGLPAWEQALESLLDETEERVVP